jgi:potassium efflux system protein
LLAYPYQMQKILRLTLFLLVTFSVATHAVYAQKSTAESRALNKKHRQEIARRDSILRAFNKTDTSLNNLLQRLEQYTVTFNQTNNNLSNELDTVDISEKATVHFKKDQ